MLVAKLALFVAYSSNSEATLRT